MSREKTPESSPLPLDGFDFGPPASEPIHQTNTHPTRSAMIARTRHSLATIERGADLSSWIGRLPDADETLHVISDGSFDLWSWAQVYLDRIGSADAVYMSTWIMSRAIAQDIVRRLDTGDIAHFHLTTGLYFRSRAADVYGYIVGELQRRRLTYCAFKNHAKVLLIGNHHADAWLCVQSSANMTKNPRTEQFCVTNSREVFEFHRRWMTEMLHR